MCLINHFCQFFFLFSLSPYCSCWIFPYPWIKNSYKSKTLTGSEGACKNKAAPIAPILSKWAYLPKSKKPTWAILLTEPSRTGLRVKPKHYCRTFHQFLSLFCFFSFHFSFSFSYHFSFSGMYKVYFQSSHLVCLGIASLSWTPWMNNYLDKPKYHISPRNRILLFLARKQPTTPTWVKSNLEYNSPQ